MVTKPQIRRRKKKTSSLNPKYTGEDSDSINLKAESKSEKENITTTKEIKEEQTKDEFAFRAIGTLYGSIEKDQEGTFLINLDGNRYRLFIPGYRFDAFQKQYNNISDKSLFLRVYPKCFIVPRMPHELYFQVLAWDKDNPWGEAPGEFIIKGVWQFLPQLRTPVISVYRNKDSKDTSGKCKAAHIPVMMRRSDGVNPFKFNPKSDKEDLTPKWFVQGRFKLLPQRNCYGWISDIKEPSNKIPWYKKPKKDEQKRDAKQKCN